MIESNWSSFFTATSVALEAFAESAFRVTLVACSCPFCWTVEVKVWIAKYERKPKKRTKRAMPMYFRRDVERPNIRESPLRTGQIA
jgi:hypothetical protein